MRSVLGNLSFSSVRPTKVIRIVERNTLKMRGDQDLVPSPISLCFEIRGRVETMLPEKGNQRNLAKILPLFSHARLRATLLLGRLERNPQNRWVAFGRFETTNFPAHQSLRPMVLDTFQSTKTAAPKETIPEVLSVCVCVTPRTLGQLHHLACGCIPRTSFPLKYPEAHL